MIPCASDRPPYTDFNEYQVLGIDIGGTKCAVSELRSGHVIEHERITTHSFATTLSAIEKTIAALRTKQPVALGISCGGPLDIPNGKIGTPPNLDASWHGQRICQRLTKQVGGRSWLMNDANACALAEWRFGAGQNCSHMVFITAGTGFGAGLILNGNLFSGASGDAGEIGHVRLNAHGPVGYGKAGSVEGFCSGGGIARLAASRYESGAKTSPNWIATGHSISAKTVVEAARAGDADAHSIMLEVGTRWGESLAILLDLFNPEKIVIGGLYPRCRDLLDEPLQTALQREALPGPLAATQIVPAELGESIGSHGAICVALHHLSTSPASSSLQPDFLSTP